MDTIEAITPLTYLQLWRGSWGSGGFPSLKTVDSVEIGMRAPSEWVTDEPPIYIIDHGTKPLLSILVSWPGAVVK